MFRPSFSPFVRFALALALLNALLVGLTLPLLAAGASFASAAQTEIPSAALTPVLLANLAGLLLSLAFGYLPGVKAWYRALEATAQAGVMALLLIAVAVALFGAGCAGLADVGVTCDQSGGVLVALALFSALTTNQSVYLLFVRPQQKQDEARALFLNAQTNALVGLIEGRVVHYVTPQEKNKHLAALVVHVWNRELGSGNPGMVNLFVPPDFYDVMDARSPTSVVYDPTGKPGTWHFIERAM